MVLHKTCVTTGEVRLESVRNSSGNRVYPRKRKLFVKTKAKASYSSYFMSVCDHEFTWLINIHGIPYHVQQLK